MMAAPPRWGGEAGVAQLVERLTCNEDVAGFDSCHRLQCHPAHRLREPRAREPARLRCCAHHASGSRVEPSISRRSEGSHEPRSSHRPSPGRSGHRAARHRRPRSHVHPRHRRRGGGVGPGAVHQEDPGQPRDRWSGQLRRPGGHPHRAPRPQARRQRGGRRGRHRRGAGGHRAVQRRDRRRRVLRLLQRRQRPGHHDRRPGDRAGVDAADRVRRSSTLRRAGDQRPVGRCAGHAGDLGDRARPVGQPQPAPGCSSRPPGWPTVDSSSTRPSGCRPPRTSRASRRTPPRPTLFLPGGAPPADRDAVREPGPGAHVPPDRPGGHRLVLQRPARTGHHCGRPVAAEVPGHPLPVPEGFMRPRDWRSTARSSAARPGPATAASRCTGCRRRPPAAPRSARR